MNPRTGSRSDFGKLLALRVCLRRYHASNKTRHDWSAELKDCLEEAKHRLDEASPAEKTAARERYIAVLLQFNAFTNRRPNTAKASVLRKMIGPQDAECGSRCATAPTFTAVPWMIDCCRMCQGTSLTTRGTDRRLVRHVRANRRSKQTAVELCAWVLNLNIGSNCLTAQTAGVPLLPAGSTILHFGLPMTYAMPKARLHTRACILVRINGARNGPAATGRR